MKKTGDILKKAREEKNLSLHEIGLSLKISSRVLKAIEEGDEKQLPAKTFLRGFVQSYANFLHLDSEKILDVFYEEMGSTRHSPYMRTPESERPPSAEDLAALAPTSTPLRAEVNAAVTEASVTPLRRKIPDSNKADGMQSLQENKSTKTIIIVVVSLILVGLIIFTKKMIDKYSKEAEVPSGEVAQTMEGATPVVVDSPVNSDTEANEATAETAAAAAVAVPSPSPTPTTSPTPTKTPSPLSAFSSTPAPAPLVSSQASPTPAAGTKPGANAVENSSNAGNKPLESATPIAAASPSPSVTPTPTPTPKPEGNKPVELIVEALDTVDIEYAAPSGKLQKIKLSAEQVHTFKSRSGLKINFSNGGAVNLIMNGKEIGIPGDLGKPIKLSY